MNLKQTALIAVMILAALSVIGFPTVMAVSSPQITDLSAPSDAEEGDSVSVSAEGVAEDELDNELRIRVYVEYPDGDTDLLCSDTTDMDRPGEKQVSCSGSFDMPDGDVEVFTRLDLSTGRNLDSESTSVDFKESSGSGGGGDGGGHDDNGEESGDDESPPQDNSGDNADEEDDEGILSALLNIPAGIVDAFTGIFDEVAEKVVNTLTYLIVSHPDVYPNDDVQDIHRTTLLVSILLAGPAIMILGILLMLGHTEIQQTSVYRHIGRLVLAVALGAVAPPLIQYAIEFSEALTIAFRPEDPGALETTLLLVELAVIAILNGMILLVIAVTFVVRDLYFLFFAAAAPFIFLLHAIPYFNRYSRVLIGTFWGFILIGPFVMIAFTLTLSLLSMDGLEAPSWLLALGGIIFMAALPLLIVPAAWTMIGPAAGVTSKAASYAADRAGEAVNNYRNRHEGTIHDLDYVEAMEWVDLTRREKRPTQHSTYFNRTDSGIRDPQEYLDYGLDPDLEMNNSSTEDSENDN